MTEQHKTTASPLDDATIQKLHTALGKNINIVLSHFLSYAPTQVDALSTAVAEGNMDFLARKAHQMKGECYQIGALTLADLCYEIEQYVDSPDNIDAQKRCLAKISTEMEIVLAALAKELVE